MLDVYAHILVAAVELLVQALGKQLACSVNVLNLYTPLLRLVSNGHAVKGCCFAVLQMTVLALACLVGYMWAAKDR